MDIQGSPSSSSSLMKKAFKHLMSESDMELLKSPAVISRAIELGMNPAEDVDLMWIAVKSLQAPLPKDWVECTTDDGYVYFWNEKVEESVWTSPVLPYYAELFKKLNLEMKQAVDDDAKTVNTTRRQETPEGTPGSAHPPDHDHTPGIPGLVSPTPPKAPRTSVYKSDSLLSPTRGGLDMDSVVEEGEGVLEMKSRGFDSKRAEMLEDECNAVKNQCRQLEGDVLRMRQEIDVMTTEKFRAMRSRQGQTQAIMNALHRSVEFLEQRGHGGVCLTHPDDHGSGEHLADDVRSCLDAFILLLGGADELDERGYAKTFNAALLRLREEIQKSFDDTGPVLGPKSIDASSLADKLRATADLIISFGEYLEPNSRNVAYAKPLLSHIISFSDKDNLVPLDIMASLGLCIGSSEIALDHLAKSDSKPLENSTPKVINMPAPSRIASVVNELEALRQENIDFKASVVDYKQQIEILQANLKGAQGRINDSSRQEEMWSNKFEALMKSMEDIKIVRQFGVPPDITGENGAQLLQAIRDNADLCEKIQCLENELIVSGKRASEAERRLERTVADYERKESEFKSKEVAVQMQLDDRKATNAALIEGREEIESLSHELYAELQDSLEAIRKLSSEKEHLKAELVKARGKGDWSVEQLTTALEAEKMRIQSYEATLEEVRREIDLRNADLSGAEARVVEAQMKADEITEHLERHVGELNRARRRNESLAAENSALLERMEAKNKDMTRLLDRLSETHGNIRVFCRVRPVFPHELDEHRVRDFEIANQVRYLDSNVVEYSGSQIFEFDHVFEMNSSQADLYDEISSTVSSLMDGHRVCILSYGITDAGKSYSLFGHITDTNNEGVVLRALAQIYTEASRDELIGIETDVQISVVDIYNDRVCDMLSKDAAEGGADLELRMGEDGLSYATGLIRKAVGDITECRKLLGLADSNRLSAAGDDLHRMIRGHLIIMVKIERFDNRSHRRTTGWLYCCDLAGSERIQGIFSSAQRLRESQIINRSLNALSEVISALGSKANKRKHIPYRNSKLTFLLQKVLRPGAKVVLLANIDPLPTHAKDTVETLRFASHCREVQLGTATRDVFYDEGSEKL